MHKFLFLLVFASSLAFADNPAKKRKRNLTLDCEYVARVMVDLVIHYEFIGAKGPEIAKIMNLIPNKLWFEFSADDIKNTMHNEDIDNDDVIWLRKKAANAIDRKASYIEMARLVSVLENNGAHLYLFDGII